MELEDEIYDLKQVLRELENKKYNKNPSNRDSMRSRAFSYNRNSLDMNSSSKPTQDFRASMLGDRNGRSFKKPSESRLQSAFDR